MQVDKFEFVYDMSPRMRVVQDAAEGGLDQNACGEVRVRHEPKWRMFQIRHLWGSVKVTSSYSGT